MVVSPVSPVMTPMGAAQAAVSEFLNSILDYVIHILGESLYLHSTVVIFVLLECILIMPSLFKMIRKPYCCRRAFGIKIISTR